MATRCRKRSTCGAAGHTRGYFQQLQAPVKGFYVFDNSAHSPLLEEPQAARRIPGVLPTTYLWALRILRNTLVVTNVFGVPDALSAAAEPTRRRILQLLAPCPQTVSEIAAEFTVTRSAISQHLGVLAEAELVAAEKVGRQRIYRVLPDGLRKLQAEIDRFWTDELDQLVADAHTLRRSP